MSKDQDIGSHHFLGEDRPVVGFPTVFGHIRPNTCRDVVVDGSQAFSRNAVLLHDRNRDINQTLSVRQFGRLFQCAVKEKCLETREIPFALAVHLLLFFT